MKDERYGDLLRHALGLKEREVISLVGGGGKTSLMFLLGNVLGACGYRVITTTTTKILVPDPDQTPFLSLGETRKAILDHVDRYIHLTVASYRVPHGKLQGITPEALEDLWQSGRVDYLVNEADGAAQRPLKAPETYEPIIPACTGVVIALMGADGFDTLLTEEKVFRASIFSRLTGLPLGSPVTDEAIALGFCHRDGIVKGAPGSARIVPFVNKVDLDGALGRSRAFARVLLDRADPRIDRVVLGQVLHEPPVVDVIYR